MKASYLETAGQRARCLIHAFKRRNQLYKGYLKKETVDEKELNESAVTTRVEKKQVEERVAIGAKATKS
jgi:hypothetical protein